MRNRVLKPVMLLVVLTGIVYAGEIRQISNAADNANRREWNRIHAAAGELTDRLRIARGQGNQAAIESLSDQISAYWEINSPDGGLNRPAALSMTPKANEASNPGFILNENLDPATAMDAVENTLNTGSRDFDCYLGENVTASEEDVYASRKSMTTDESGTVYIAYAFMNGESKDIRIRKSEDGGSSWLTVGTVTDDINLNSPDLVVFEDHIFMVYEQEEYDDVMAFFFNLSNNTYGFTRINPESHIARKPKILTEAYLYGQQAYLYVAYHNDIADSGDLFLSRCVTPLSGEFDFNIPVQITNHAEIVQSNFSIDWGSNLKFYVTYTDGSDSGRQRMRISYDFGLSVGPPITLANGDSNAHISIAASRTSNAVAIAYTETTLVHDRNVLLQWTYDEGENWYLQTMADQPLGDEIFPTIATDYWGSDSRFFMTWYAIGSIVYTHTLGGLDEWQSTPCLASEVGSIFNDATDLVVLTDSEGTYGLVGWSWLAPWQGAVRVSSDRFASPTSVAEPNEISPVTFQLLENFPNPFNPTTTLRYRLESPGEISLRIFDLSGREVAELVNGYQAAGTHEVDWQLGAGMSDTGIYFARLVSNESSLTTKLTVIK